jgi:hypothetical protein
MGGLREGDEYVWDGNLGDGANVGSPVVREDRLDSLGESGEVGLTVCEEVRKVPGLGVRAVPNEGEAPGLKSVLRMQEGWHVLRSSRGDPLGCWRQQGEVSA